MNYIYAVLCYTVCMYINVNYIFVEVHTKNMEREVAKMESREKLEGKVPEMEKLEGEVAEWRSWRAKSQKWRSWRAKSQKWRSWRAKSQRWRSCQQSLLVIDSNASKTPQITRAVTNVTDITSNVWILC
jgi:hypothetical protein